jgi:hypothetical protein
VFLNARWRGQARHSPVTRPCYGQIVVGAVEVNIVRSLSAKLKRKGLDYFSRTCLVDAAVLVATERNCCLWVVAAELGDF